MNHLVNFRIDEMNTKGVEAALYSAQPPARKRHLWQVIFVVCASILCLYNYSDRHHFFIQHNNAGRSLTKHQEITLQASIDRCKQIGTPAGPPVNFSKRTRSDRAIEGAAPLVIKNVTLWTGKPEEGDSLGQELYEVDVSIADGIIKAIDKVDSTKIEEHSVVIEGYGRWMTPGIIDVHIHAGLDVLPALRGLDDTNSLKSPVSPYLRSIDGVSNHDWSFISIASGGITTGLALPGSADNVGGQAFVIKLGRLGKKPVSEGGWTRLVDPPRSLILPGEGQVGRDGLYEQNTGMKRLDGSSSFRYMKMACGENDRRVYKETRMDEAKNFRQMFNQARLLMNKQDDFCEKLLQENSRLSVEDFNFPDDFLLEAVVDVLRGKTKVNTHCYTLEDFSSFVSHTNEFEFPLAAFHHAHEAYLVPDLLKKVYGEPPAIAMFSLNANYKTESYFGSPFAAAVLSNYNITTLTKSDHPVTDSRRLLSQVAQAHHFGLSAGKALRGVTSSAAKVLGLDHRIGQARIGYDADLVLWDKHPLKLGAKPVEVIIDGVRQQLVKKDESEPFKDENKGGEISETNNNLDEIPSSANYNEEIKRVIRAGPEIIAWESSAFPIVKKRVRGVRLFNVSQVFSIEGDGHNQEIVSSTVNQVYLSQDQGVCLGDEKSCPGHYDEEIDLKGGILMPGLVAFGSTLGVADIVAEPATRDGDAAQGSPLALARDALRFGGNDLQFAHSLGIRSVISAPEADVGLIQGVAVHFDAGAEELLEKGAIRKEQVALHLFIDHWQASDSLQPTMGQQIAMLKKMLMKGEGLLTKVNKVDDVDEQIWANVANGTLPLIVQVHQAETISQLIKMKISHPKVKLILRSADEASFGSIPKRLKDAEIPVLIRPIEWPQLYDARRAVKLGGIQASRNEKMKKSSLLGVLIDAGVKVGLTIDESWQATTLLWDAIAAGREAGLSDKQSLHLATAGTANILNIDLGKDVVAFDQSPFEYGARPVAISTPRGIDLMD